MLTSAEIVLDTHFLAQLGDASKWEERFDILVDELREQYGPYFLWSNTPRGNVDILFIMYPPSEHRRMVTDRIVEDYISTRPGTLSRVHVIVIGRNSKDSKVDASDVVDIVNSQCIPCGVKADPMRVARPEDLDDQVRATLVRLLTRRQQGAPRVPIDALLSESSGAVHASNSLRLPYESSDL